MEEVVKIRRKKNGESFELAESLLKLAVWQKTLNTYPKDENEKNYRDALEMARRVLPENDMRLTGPDPVVG